MSVCMDRKQRVQLSLSPDVMERLSDEENMSAVVEEELRDRYDEL